MMPLWKQAGAWLREHHRQTEPKPPTKAPKPNRRWVYWRRRDQSVVLYEGREPKDKQQDAPLYTETVITRANVQSLRKHLREYHDALALLTSIVVRVP